MSEFVTITNQTFELPEQLTEGLIKFLTSFSPEPDICDFLGMDNSAEYTIFNLYDKLSTHMNYIGKAKYYRVTDQFREALSLQQAPLEMSVATIINHLMSYSKQHNPNQDPQWWYCYHPYIAGHTSIDIFEVHTMLYRYCENPETPIYVDIYTLDDKLSEFIGSPSRAEINKITVLKRMFEYIRDNKLQNPHNKVEILPDEKLLSLLDAADNTRENLRRTFNYS